MCMSVCVCLHACVCVGACACVCSCAFVYVSVCVHERSMPNIYELLGNVNCTRYDVHLLESPSYKLFIRVSLWIT